MDEWRNEYNQFQNLIKFKERKLLELKKSDQIEYLKKEQDEKIKYLEKEKERLEKEIEIVKKEKERVEKEKILLIKKKKDEINSLIENVNKLEKEQKKLIGKIDNLKKEKSLLKSQIDELGKEKKKEKDKDKDKLTDILRKKIDEQKINEQNIIELEKKIQKANEESNAAVGKKNELLDEIKTLRTNITKKQTDFDIEIAGLTRGKNNTEKRLEELIEENEILYKSNSDQNKKLLLMRRKRFELAKEKNDERDKMEKLIREKEKEIRKLTITKDLGITMSDRDVEEAAGVVKSLREEIAELRVKEERGNYELGPVTLKNKIKAIFKRYGLTFAAVFSSVGVVIGIIISSITPGLAKTNRILSNGLKNIEDKLKQLANRSPNKPGIFRMITEFIFKTAGEVFGFLGNNTWLLIFLVVIFYINNEI